MSIGKIASGFELVRKGTQVTSFDDNGIKPNDFRTVIKFNDGTEVDNMLDLFKKATGTQVLDLEG